MGALNEETAGFSTARPSLRRCGRRMTMLKTPLCRNLGIQCPIMSAPLGGGTAGPELAAAVSEAGGLGLLGMGGVAAPVIREQIRDTRTRTSKPFGVGLLLPMLQGGEV